MHSQILFLGLMSLGSVIAGPIKRDEQVVVVSTVIKTVTATEYDVKTSYVEVVAGASKPTKATVTNASAKPTQTSPNDEVAVSWTTLKPVTTTVTEEFHGIGDSTSFSTTTMTHTDSSVLPMTITYAPSGEPTQTFTVVPTRLYRGPHRMADGTISTITADGKYRYATIPVKPTNTRDTVQYVDLVRLTAMSTYTFTTEYFGHTYTPTITIPAAEFTSSLTRINKDADVTEIIQQFTSKDIAASTKMETVTTVTRRASTKGSSVIPATTFTAKTGMYAWVPRPTTFVVSTLDGKPTPSATYH